MFDGLYMFGIAVIGYLTPVSLGLAFGYSMNQMGPGILLNERGQSLVDATYRVLGG